MQGNYSKFFSDSVIFVLLMLLCLPCFAKQSFKESWGLPIVEGKSTSYFLSVACSVEAEFAVKTQTESNERQHLPLSFHSASSGVPSPYYVLIAAIGTTFSSQIPFQSNLHIRHRQFRI